MVLFGLMSTAEAAHLHRLAPKATGAHLQSPEGSAPSLGGEEQCSLCIAMHGVLPASMHIATTPAVPLVAAVSFAQARPAAVPWHYPRFSRPPPALV